MAGLCDKLSGPHFNIAPTPHDDIVNDDITAIGVENVQLVTGLDGAADLLTQIQAYVGCDQTRSKRTLDLVAHAVPDGYLDLGTSVINMNDQSVQARIAAIAESGVLEQLNVTKVRLLGCFTATAGGAQATIKAMAATLGCVVAGTTIATNHNNFIEGGFDPRYEPYLVDSDKLPTPSEAKPWPPPTIDERLFSTAPPIDVASLPAQSIDSLGPVRWPIHTLPPWVSAPLTALVDATRGLVVPGLLTEPLIEILIAVAPRQVQRVQILFNWELVRVRPGFGDEVYPVRSPDELRTLVAAASASARRAVTAR